jgi:hypothetical protein
MLLLLETGFRLGVRFEKARGGEAASIFDSAVFALLGLLLGFAFAGAVDRLDKRRDLIVAEATDISTAYLRLDILAPEDQPAIRALFRQFLEARIRVYRVIDAERDPATAFDTAERLQAEIWTAAVVAVGRPDRQYASEIVLPAINDMIDVTTKRKERSPRRYLTLCSCCCLVFRCSARLLPAQACRGTASAQSSTVAFLPRRSG